MGVIEAMPTNPRAGVCAIKVVGRAILNFPAGGSQAMIGAKLYAKPWTQEIHLTPHTDFMFVGIVIAPGPTWHPTQVEIVIMH
jgi:hypothetical protein